MAPTRIISGGAGGADWAITVIGAGLVNFAKTWLTGALPEIWLFALGGIFIAVTLLLPRGILGLFRRRQKRRAAARPAPVDAAAE